MTKYNIDDTLYWIRYNNNIQEIIEFNVGCIKTTKEGIKYGTGRPACGYIKEELCYLSPKEAIEAACNALKSLAL